MVHVVDCNPVLITRCLLASNTKHADFCLAQATKSFRFISMLFLLITGLGSPVNRHSVALSHDRNGNRNWCRSVRTKCQRYLKFNSWFNFNLSSQVLKLNFNWSDIYVNSSINSQGKYQLRIFKIWLSYLNFQSSFHFVWLRCFRSFLASVHKSLK